MTDEEFFICALTGEFPYSLDILLPKLIEHGYIGNVKYDSNNNLKNIIVLKSFNAYHPYRKFGVLYKFPVTSIYGGIEL